MHTIPQSTQQLQTPAPPYTVHSVHCHTCTTNNTRQFINCCCSSPNRPVSMSFDDRQVSPSLTCTQTGPSTSQYVTTRHTRTQHVCCLQNGRTEQVSSIHVAIHTHCFQVGNAQPDTWLYWLQDVKGLTFIYLLPITEQVFSIHVTIHNPLLPGRQCLARHLALLAIGCMFVMGTVYWYAVILL